MSDGTIVLVYFAWLLTWPIGHGVGRSAVRHDYEVQITLDVTKNIYIQ